MKRTLGILALIILLSGCTSMHDFAREHPVITAFGAAIVVGAVAASSSSDSSNGPLPIESGTMPCRPQPDGSCR